MRFLLATGDDARESERVGLTASEVASGSGDILAGFKYGDSTEVGVL